MWAPQGPHSVGVVDLEWDAKPEAGYDDMHHSEHVAGRLFYPTVRRDPKFWEFGIPWLPHFNYARGLSRFFFFRRDHSWLNIVACGILQGLIFLLGTLQRLWLIPGAPLLPPRAPDGGRPVVIFSHGLAGYRSMYSLPCAELASQGYVVLAVEHCDGTSSSARLARSATKKGRWLFYEGMGTEAQQVERTRLRTLELQTAFDVLEEMTHGGDAARWASGHHIMLSCGKDPATFLAGSLDMTAVAAVGHSYGGATVAALTAVDARFGCAIALDPWWNALPPESAARHAWKTADCPLLILGSHTWNRVQSDGTKYVGERQQQAVLRASSCGAGALLLVIRGTSHNSFADPLPLFSSQTGWLLRCLGMDAELDAVLGMELIMTATLDFLDAHLGIGPGARAEQNWAAKREERVARRDGVSRPRSRLFQGQGIAERLSERLLRRTIGGHGGSAAVAKGPTKSPRDVATLEELARAAAPAVNGQHKGEPQPLVRRGPVGSRDTRESQNATSRADVTRLESLLGPDHIFEVELASAGAAP